jgi:hypothetical protein
VNYGCIECVACFCFISGEDRKLHDFALLRSIGGHDEVMDYFARRLQPF